MHECEIKEGKSNRTFLQYSHVYRKSISERAVSSVLLRVPCVPVVPSHRFTDCPQVACLVSCVLWLLTLEEFSTVWHQLKGSLHVAFMVLRLSALQGVVEAWQFAY